jgi:hypothetical protein
VCFITAARRAGPNRYIVFIYACRRRFRRRIRPRSGFMPVVFDEAFAPKALIAEN